MQQILGKAGIDYWEWPRFHVLCFLEGRRERFVVIYTWKILENVVPSLATARGRRNHCPHKSMNRQVMYASVHHSPEQCPDGRRGQL